MLAGTFRRGSGITGSGTEAVAPVVIGPLCESEAPVSPPLRAFGAGLGTGTVCADDGIVMPVRNAAITTASPARRPGLTNCAAVRSFGFLFNASSCQASGHFIVVSAKGGIVFP